MHAALVMGAAMATCREEERRGGGAETLLIAIGACSSLVDRPVN
jgi:uncharacterized membrane protein YhiD involved in acid resistance